MCWRTVFEAVAASNLIDLLLVRLQGVLQEVAQMLIYPCPKQKEGDSNRLFSSWRNIQKDLLYLLPSTGPGLCEARFSQTRWQCFWKKQCFALGFPLFVIAQLKSKACRPMTAGWYGKNKETYRENFHGWRQTEIQKCFSETFLQLQNICGKRSVGIASDRQLNCSWEWELPSTFGLWSSQVWLSQKKKAGSWSKVAY